MRALLRALLVLGGTLLGCMLVLVLSAVLFPDVNYEKILPYLYGGMAVGALAGFLAGQRLLLGRSGERA
ncbi:hypothetical protein OOT46_22925 [Aquabacterium sp. A7-Y]|uniref:hypothetical protein n=1 Tax=Aquabacterium sp. A7-Y TaxID=1349605 RepID=UPI00223C9E3E|nr:hypothetical protein [Aquabacterium sp. A7-Y]MCW7540677.1 hypothetical protein [Aquabacterium sp. A7-Y]